MQNDSVFMNQTQTKMLKIDEEEKVDTHRFTDKEV